MKTWLIVVLVVLFLPGCDNTARNQELEQQKLLLQLSKVNNERLAELAEKEKNIQAYVQQINQQKDLLRKRESDISEREQKIAEAELQTQQAQQAIVAKQAQLDKLLADIRQKEAVAELERQKQEVHLNADAAKRAEKRKDDLDELINLSIDLTMKIAPSTIRSNALKEISSTLAAEKWGQIEEEDAFASQVRRATQNYFNKRFGGWGNSLKPEQEEKITPALEQWEKQYLQKHQPTSGPKDK